MRAFLIAYSSAVFMSVWVGASLKLSLQILGSCVSNGKVLVEELVVDFNIYESC